MPWPANKILTVLAGTDTAASAQEIAARSGLTLQQVWDATETLVKNKLAKRPERGSYQITDAGRAAITEGKGGLPGPQGPTGPVSRRKKTLRERIWLVLRIEKKGTVGDFVSMILRDDEDEDILIRNTQKYLSYLCRAGYVSRLPGRARGTAPQSNGFVRYLLVENTGPSAPMVRRIENALFDPNTSKTIPFQEVTREP